MNQLDTIEHEGIIRSINNNNVEVEIINGSECHSCYAKGACALSGNKNKIVTLSVKEDFFSVGDSVFVILKKNLTWKAVFYGYLIPFLLLVFTLMSSLNILKNEALAGIISISILIPYYFIIYCMKSKLNKEFEFQIKPFK